MSTPDTEDGEPGVVTKKVNITSLAHPNFLTLVKYPGNQVAFKVVRKDDSTATATVAVTEEVDAAPLPRIRRARSISRSALLAIEYPSDISEEDAKEDLDLMGVTGYSMHRQEDGRLVVTRSDLTEMPTNTFRVGLGDNRFATILRSESATPSAASTGPAGIALVAIDFNNDQFPDEEAVLSYLSRREVTYLDEAVTRSDGHIRVLCSEAPEGAEIRTMEVDPGVVISVVRAEETNILGEPSFTSVINDTAYGMWGWGQLDFSAALADVKFSEAGRKATDKLAEVLNEILFYSSLPVTVRKELVVRAVNQYALYTVSLLEALPEKLVVINRNSVQENRMPNPQKKDEVAPVETPTAETVPVEAGITRADVKQIVAEALAEFVAAQQQSAPVVRADEAETVADKPATDQTVTVLEAVQRSVAEMAATLSGVDSRLATMESATVVRSDSTDSKPAPTVKVDPFAGIFGQRIPRTPR